VQLDRMRFTRALFCAAILLLACTACASAGDLTRRSGVAGLAHLKQYYQVPGFRIGGAYKLGDPGSYELGGQGGVTLESLGAGPLRTSYIAVGVPQRNVRGEITNAIIISPYYAGDASHSYNFWYQGQAGNDFAQGAVVGPGLLIDTNKYYVVFLDALGLWGASKPSGGLGPKFPSYNYFDYVQANYRLLKDHLKVARIKLAMGFSMGAMQSYVWALLHPEMVEAIMPISGASTIKNDAVARWMFQLMTAAMQSDPVWQSTKGDYYHLPKESHPNQGLMFGWSLLAQSGFGYDMRVGQGWDAVEPEVFYWNPQASKTLAWKSRPRITTSTTCSFAIRRATAMTSARTWAASRPRL
jgi:homoserine O-acetyltransferase